MSLYTINSIYACQMVGSDGSYFDMKRYIRTVAIDHSPTKLDTTNAAGGGVTSVPGPLNSIITIVGPHFSDLDIFMYPLDMPQSGTIETPGTITSYTVTDTPSSAVFVETTDISGAISLGGTQSGVRYFYLVTATPGTFVATNDSAVLHKGYVMIDSYRPDGEGAHTLTLSPSVGKFSSGRVLHP